MLKAGVLGAGHLGKIHLRLLKESEKYELIGFYDVDEESGEKIEEEFGYKYFNDLDEINSGSRCCRCGHSYPFPF